MSPPVGQSPAPEPCHRTARDALGCQSPRPAPQATARGGRKSGDVNWPAGMAIALAPGIAVAISGQGAVRKSVRRAIIRQQEACT
jgi:hypothetical protein